MPVRTTDCGLPVALSVIVIPPVRVLGAVGLKVTVIVQERPAARLEPQLLVSEKFPVIFRLVMVRVSLPALVRVTFCGGLLVPTN
jgi:hypothetical protein